MINLELLFSLAGLLAMGGWLLLLLSPLTPVWSDRIAGLVIPALLSTGYVALVVLLPSEGEGGFGSLADVTNLFANENAMLAGWVHFLAFDLFVGAWICRTARREGIRFWFIVPCLPLTFLYGPAGYLAYVTVRQVSRRKH